MSKSKQSVPTVSTSGTSPTAIPPQDLITIEEMARRLRPDQTPQKGIAWVREKCRRRSPNAIPVYNLGRHLMFDWRQVSAWIQNLSRPVHAPHRRRKNTTKRVAA